MTQLWSKADLHIHSSYSDGAHDIRTLLAHVADQTDLRVIAITDHDQIEGALRARDMAPRYGLQVVVGEEVSTTRGHLLALFIREHIPARMSLPETVACVHAQGGLAILAHPLDRLANSPMRRWPRPSPDDWLGFGLDGLEALNGSQLDPQAYVQATRLGKALGLALAGGSDAHHKAAIGVACTLFPGNTVSDLRRAIEARTASPGGRRWNSLDYAHWIARSWAPRTFHFLTYPRPVRFLRLPA